MSSGPAAPGRRHDELLGALLGDARERFRDAERAWDPARPGIEALPDHGRALLDSYAAALHVLWTYHEAWGDEGYLSRCRLADSGQRLLELVGLYPDPGAAATGWQAVRCVAGREGTVPPGFAVRAPAASGRPAQTYETLRARRVSWRLNEVRADLPPAAGDVPVPAPGAVSAVVEPGTGSSAGASPFARPSTASALLDRLQAARAGTLAQRRAAQARQTALRLAELARTVAPAAEDGCGCGEAFSVLCRELGEAAAAAGGPAAPEPGPLSQSQETLIGTLARLADRDPAAFDALDAALARGDGEDDAAYSRRLDQAAAFLDALVGGLQQHARDQVVLLQGSQALVRVDTAAGATAGVTRRGTAQPGTDALFLEADAVGMLTALLAPGDWLVLGEDARASASDPDAGTTRIFHEAVQIVRLDEEVPPGRDRPMTRVTFHPPLARRYRLDDTVVLGNVLEISHGATVREAGVHDPATAPLRPTQSPLTWLRDTSPLAVDGRRAQVGLATGGREWQEVTDLAGRPGVEPVFAVRTEPGRQARIVVGDDREGASIAPGAPYLLRYRIGTGTDGDQPPGGIRDLASTHPAVLDTSNPLPVDGGADPEPFERTRERARAGLHGLQRAISAPDVASLATTFGGVRQATVAAGVPGRRHRLRIVACADGGGPLSEAELAGLTAFLTQRMPPGTGVLVRDRTLVGVRATIRLMVVPGENPLPVIAAVQARLGARRVDGVEPGLLDPAAAVLGRSLSTSDLYRTLEGLPALAAAVVTGLHRDGEPPARRDRVTVTAADLVVWALDAPGEPSLRLSWAAAVDP